MKTAYDYDYYYVDGAHIWRANVKFLRLSLIRKESYWGVEVGTSDGGITFHSEALNSYYTPIQAFYAAETILHNVSKMLIDELQHIMQERFPENLR